MGRPSIKNITALESALTALKNDEQGADLAPDLLAKSIALADVSDLTLRFWGLELVGIKSVRAAIYSLAELTPEKLRKMDQRALNSVLFYTKEIVATDRHLEHLSTHEWSLLWHFLAIIPYSSCIFSSVCICWGKLLAAPQSIPDLDFVQDLINVPTEPSPQVYDGYFMACIRQAWELIESGHQKSTLGRALLERALQLIDRPRIKNLLFCRELALLAVNLDPLEESDALNLQLHLDPHLGISPGDMQYTANQFSARPGTDDLPWIVSKALARHYSDSRPHKRARHEQDAHTQLACFNGSLIPSHNASFWYYIWVGINCCNHSNQDLLDMFASTLKNYTQFEATPFALAQLLQELTARDKFPGLILPQLNVFLASYDSQTLSSASIYLYRVLKTINILDQEFQHLVAAKLDPWLEKSLLHDLETTQLPLGIFIDLIGSDLSQVDLSSASPSRGSFITGLGLCLYFGYQVTFEPPNKFIKADIIALIELCRVLTPLGLVIPSHLASQLVSVVEAAEVDPQLIWTAVFLLDTQRDPTIEQFPFAPVPESVSQDQFKATVGGIFGNYRFNRSPQYIKHIIALMKRMNKAQKSWQEFYAFLLNTVCEQSPFSPLRLPIAELIQSSDDWRKLFETSAPSITLEAFDSFNLQQDFGPVLSARVPESIHAEFLYKLAKSGANMASIVAHLIDKDPEYIEKIANHFNTTPDGLLRDICPKLFLSWSLTKPISQFPWDKLDNSDGLKTQFPLALLPRDWITEKTMFASYYVYGLQDNNVALDLKSQYSERQFDAQLKRRFTEIQYKCWSTVAIPRDPFWSGFPEPELVDVWLQNVPSQYDLDDQTACWIMEQLVLSVSRFRREDLYTTLRQIYMMYQSLDSPILATWHFIRSCVILVQLSSQLDPAFEHILKEMAPRLEGGLVSELLAQYPHYSRLFDTEYIHDEGVETSVMQLCQGMPLKAGAWVQSFLDLDSQEFAIYYARYLCDQLQEVIETLEFEASQRKVLAPRLYRWTRVFSISSPTWLAFVGKLAGEFSVTEYYNTKESIQDRMIEDLRNFCSQHGYLARFSLASFMRRLGPDAVLGSALNSASVSNLGSIKDLSTKQMQAIDIAPTDRLLDTSCELYELSIQLHSHVATYPLYRALRINPQLAPRLVPYQVARLCQDEHTLQNIRKIISVQLENQNSTVQVLMLRIIDECYRAGYTVYEYETAIQKCISLNQGSLGLMILEVSRNESIASKYLSDLLDIVADPDLKHGKPSVPSLATMQLSGWDNLAYSLTTFNKHTAQNLRDSGIYKLANLVEKSSYFDYDSAWALEQWDLPTRPPTTRRELLFDLFSTAQTNTGRLFDFDQAYCNSWKVLDKLSPTGSPFLLPDRPSPALGCAQDVYKIESISANSSCHDTDTRLAREYYFKRQNNPDSLVRDISLNVQMFCREKNKELALLYAQKLENIVSTMDREAQLMSKVQSASTAWLLGDQVTSINMLEDVSKHPLSRFYYQSSVLTTLAEWSAQAHHVSDSVLFDEYLEPAVQHSLEQEDLSVRASTFHTFAKFCDERFGNKTLSSELYQARAMRDEQKQLIQDHKNIVREDRENKLAHSKLRRAMQLYEIQQKEYQDLKERMRMYLDNSVKFYLKSLELGISNTLRDSGRFIALWFANNEYISLESIIQEQLGNVPSHLFIPWVNQLTSRLESNGTKFQAQLSALVLRLAKNHPYHTLWPIFSLSLGEKTSTRATAGANILKKCASNDQFSNFGNHMISVANHKVKSEDKNNFSFSKMRDEKKWWTGIASLRLVSPIQNIPVDPGGKYEDIPYIQQVDQHISIASGISAPKIIQYIASDGNLYTMLLKGGNDDLRQDAVMEQVFGHVNSFLEADRDAQKRNLRARTYAVVPLGPKAGVIEFVQDTKSLINVLSPLHEQADGRDWTLAKARDTMHRSFDFGKEARIQAYLEVCRHIRPCLGNFFFEQYRNSEAWLRSRTNFSRSTALMSMIGYILGLGDRHCNNILLDIVSGEVVHIDLGIAFDQGKILRIPETVPFRLTRDFVDALGICGTDGVFNRVAELSLGLMRVEEERIMTVLEVLRYDPLYSWTISTSRNKHAQPGAASNFVPKSTDAEQALLGVRRKLGEKLNVKATLRELVQQATSSRNLALIYEGWCPFY